VSDQYKPQQFNYFTKNAASDVSDPFGQIRQPELQPSFQSLLLNKPSSLPQFSLPVTAQQATVNTGVTNANPYAAGAAIVSARPGHFLSSGLCNCFYIDILITGVFLII